MNNKLAGLLVIKRDNHENRYRRTFDIQSINWTMKTILRKITKGQYKLKYQNQSKEQTLV